MTKRIYCHLAFVVLLFFCINIYSRSYSELKSNNYSMLSSAKDGSNIPIFLITFDPAGFLIYGPTLQAELATGSIGSISTGVRVVHLGLITRILEEDLEFGMSISVSYKFYIKQKKKLGGFYVGPFYEFGRIRNNYGYYSSIEREDIRKYDMMMGGAEYGYRWIWDNGFSIGVSGSTGIVIRQRVDEHAGENEIWKYERFLPILPSFKIGYAF